MMLHRASSNQPVRGSVGAVKLDRLMLSSISSIAMMFEALP